MFIDAYQTIDILCYSLQHSAIGQAGILLRQLLEQTSISCILAEHQELLPKYIEHMKLKKELMELLPHEQIEKISKQYNIKQNPSVAYSYLDYGWIPLKSFKEQNEDGMIVYAGFKDILSWKKTYLDKIAHSSFTTIDFLGKEYDFPIVSRFIEIMCKLFDHLCVYFHNLTKFNFVFDGQDFFKQFRDVYSSLKN